MSDGIGSTEYVTVETADGPMRLYEAKPAGDRAARSWWSKRRSVSTRISKTSRAASPPPATTRSRPTSSTGQVPARSSSTASSSRSWSTSARSGGDDAILADVDAALAHLRARRLRRRRASAQSGSASAGRVSFLIALRRALGAAVGFYGGGIVTGRFPQFPPLVDRGRDAADARGSGSSATRTHRFPSTTSRRCARR